MNRVLLSLMVVLFLVNGCLVVSATEYHITFDEKFKRGKIKIIFNDLRSDNIPDPAKKDSVFVSEMQRKRQGDFDDLLEMVKDDESLLDAVDMGIYLKKRYLAEANGQLNGYWEGIFNKLRFTDEKESLQVLDNEIVVKIKKEDEDDYVETDGQLSDHGDYVQITWPKTQHEIYWKIISKEDKTGSVSLINEYRKWNANRVVE